MVEQSVADEGSVSTALGQLKMLTDNIYYTDNIYNNI